MFRCLYIILREFIIIIIYAEVTKLITCKHIISSLTFSCSYSLDEILLYPENGGRNCLRNFGKGLPEPTLRVTMHSILIYTNLFHIRTNRNQAVRFFEIWHRDQPARVEAAPGETKGSKASYKVTNQKKYSPC